VIKALKSIKKGEEILNDYGPLPRSDLLRRYGYLTDNYAPYDVVELSQEFVVTTVISQIENGLSDVSARVSLISSKGVDISRNYYLT
jgi:N-lysine methyltransferase SETD6